MNARRKMKSYDDDFKRKAVELVTVAGRKASVVEKELGIYQGAIAGWRSAFERDAGTATKESEELRKLRRELRDAQMENEILKKAMGYLAKSQQ